MTALATSFTVCRSLVELPVTPEGVLHLYGTVSTPYCICTCCIPVHIGDTWLSLIMCLRRHAGAGSLPTRVIVRSTVRRSAVPAVNPAYPITKPSLETEGEPSRRCHREQSEKRNPPILERSARRCSRRGRRYRSGTRQRQRKVRLGLVTSRLLALFCLSAGCTRGISISYRRAFSMT